MGDGHQRRDRGQRRGVLVPVERGRAGVGHGRGEPVGRPGAAVGGLRGGQLDHARGRLILEQVRSAAEGADLTVAFDVGQNSDANFAHLAQAGLSYVGSVPAGDGPDLLVLLAADRTLVDKDRSGGLTACDTRRTRTVTLGYLGVTQIAASGVEEACGTWVKFSTRWKKESTPAGHGKPSWICAPCYRPTGTAESPSSPRLTSGRAGACPS